MSYYIYIQHINGLFQDFEKCASELVLKNFTLLIQKDMQSSAFKNDRVVYIGLTLPQIIIIKSGQKISNKTQVFKNIR